jgi:type I restriction enzyme, S subunit
MKNGWQRKQLGELAELKGRIGWRGLTAKEYTESGPLFISVHSLNYGDYVDVRDAFHISEARYAESPEIMLREHDVLICKDGAGIGKVGIVGELPDRATINSSLLLIRCNRDIRPKFLYYCLSSPYFQQIAASRLNGATTPHLYQRDITEFPVVLPPLCEQERIVGILDEAFEGIATAKANAEKNLQNARALFENHTQSVFTQRGPEWAEKALGSLATFRNGVNFTKESRGKQIKIVGVRNFQNHFLAPLDDLDTVTIDRELSEAATLKSDDILAVRSNGNIALIGRCILVGHVRERTTHSGFTIRIRVSTKELIPRYLCHFMKVASSRKQLAEGGTGTNIKSLNQGLLSSLVIPLPPVSTQMLIVKKLEGLSDETQRLCRVYESKVAALEALKRSLLHEAFTGKL